MSRLIALLLTAWLIGSVWLLHSWSGSQTDLQVTRIELQELKNEHIIYEQERRALQATITASAKAYLREREDAQVRSADVIADHLADNKRLRVRVDTLDSQCSRPSDSGSEPYGYARLHRTTAEAIVAITNDADSKVRALQDIILQLTKQKE